MIFNRLTGLDLGPPPSYLIPGNIQQADGAGPLPVPVERGDPGPHPVAGLRRQRQHHPGPRAAISARSTACSATFAPQKACYGIDYLAINSANFPGLLALEELIKKIGPPQWPWTVNNTLADQGEAIFNLPTASGGCVDCHGIKPGVTRPIDQKTWADADARTSAPTRASTTSWPGRRRAA